jgi:hypothetical protein
MGVSDGAGHYTDFNCNGCGGHGSGARWFCAPCRADFCFRCRPPPPLGSAEAEAALLALKASLTALVGKRLVYKGKPRSGSGGSSGNGGGGSGGGNHRAALVGTLVTVLAVRETARNDTNGKAASAGSGQATAGGLGDWWSLDLVCDDGTVWFKEPPAHVQAQDLRTPRGVPPPPVLQRSFTAVTTQKRPVTEGGWEFDKPRERMVDAGALVKAKARLEASSETGGEDEDEEDEGEDEEDGGDNREGGGNASAEEEEKLEEAEDEDEEEEEKESAGSRGGLVSAQGDVASLYPLPSPFPRLAARLLLRRPRLDGCPGKHALAFFQTPNPSFSCDACGFTEHAAGADMHG